MFSPRANEPDPSGTPPSAGIHDRRPKPSGILPRQLQMWLMVGLAVVMLALIVLTGHPQPPASRADKPSVPASAQPERIRNYQNQLAEEEARLRQAIVEQSRQLPAADRDVPQEPRPADPLADERRRRDYQSLFADNVALSRRPATDQPAGARVTPAEPPRGAAAALSPPSDGRRPVAEPSPPQPPPAASGFPRANADEPTPPIQTDPIPASGPLQRLLEGTVIETVLLNRLDGTFSGPVTCLVTTPVYSHSRQDIVIPAGARVLGSAAPIQSWGESRLAVRFHRLVMPDGRTYSLDRFKGLNQIGATGLRDQVNRHYAQIFGASLAIGALSGLAQYNTRGSPDGYAFGDAYRQTAGASLATSAGRVLDRFLNVLPTITIREGHRLKVYLTNDLELPVFPGGVR